MFYLKEPKSLESDESWEQTLEKWHLMQVRDRDVGVSVGFHGDNHSYSQGSVMM